MVGSALVREAEKRGGFEVLSATRAELDLTSQEACHRWLAENKPDQVVIAAAKVGGIHANSTYPAEFIYENLAEDCLLTSPLEITNEAYAIAKIAGLKMCQHYRAQYGLMYHSAMPTNLYGPGDNYHPENSHVIPALIRRFHEAKERGDQEVQIWGSGTPRREFLHVDDLANACFHLLEHDSPPDWVNLGVGEDVTILELAQLVAKTVGFEGNITTDPSKPDGTPRKLLDVSLLKEAGWSAQIPFADGLAGAYQDFLATLTQGTARL